MHKLRVHNPHGLGQLAPLLENIQDMKKDEDETFRLVVEFAPNGVIAVNDRGEIILVNSQTEKLFGYRREELLGQPIEILVPQPLRDHHVRLREDFVSRPQARPMGAGRDLYGCRKDGTQFPVEIGLNPIETGEGTWIISSIVDITERKRSEQALRDSEEQFRSVFRDSCVGMVIVSLEGRFLAVNAAFCDFLGYSEKELVGKDFEAVTDPEGWATSMQKFRQALADRGIIRRFEKRYLRKDGQPRWGEVSASLVRTMGGEPRYFVAHVLDITDRR